MVKDISTLITNTKYLYIAKVITQFFGFMSSVLIIRMLKVDVFGIYSLLLQIYIVVRIFAFSPIEQSFYRFIPEFDNSDNYYGQVSLIKYGALFSILFVILILFIIFLFSDTIGFFFNIPNLQSYYCSFSLFIIFFLIKDFLTSILQSFLLQKSISYNIIINNILRFVFYVFFFDQMNIVFLLNIEIILSIVMIIPFLIILIKWFKNKNPNYSNYNKNIKTNNRKRIIRYSILSFGNVLGQGVVGTTSDYFIIASGSINNFELGLYAFANKIYQIIYRFLPFKEFYAVMRPILVKRYDNNYKNFGLVYSFLIKVLLPVYLFPVLYFIFFGKNVINLIFTDEYVSAYLITVILLLNMILSSWYNAMSLLINLKEKVGILLYSKITLVFSIVGGIIAMKYIGVIGVALATTLGSYLQTFIIWLFARKFNEVKNMNFNKFGNLILVLLFISPFFIFYFVTLHFVWFVISSFFFTITYVFLFVKFHLFTTEEMEIFNRVLEGSNIFKYVINLKNKIL